MKWVRPVLVALSLVLMLAALPASQALAVPTGWKVSVVSSWTGFGGAPLGVSNDRAIWSVYGKYGPWLWTRKLDSSTPAVQLTFGDYSFNSRAAISGDRLAWSLGLSRPQLITQDLSTGVPSEQLSPSDSWAVSAAVSGDRVAWLQLVGDDYQVFTQDLAAGTPAVQITSDAHDHKGLVLSNNRLGWLADSGDALTGYQVFTQDVHYDPAPVPLSRTGQVQALELSGDQFIWTAPSNGYTQVYSLKLSDGLTPRIVSEDVGLNHSAPAVSDDRLAWLAGVGSGNLYTLKVGSGQSPVLVAGNANPPALHWNRLAWLGGPSGTDIYTMKIGTDAAPIKLTDADQAASANPCVYGDTVLYTVVQNGTTKVLLAEMDWSGNGQVDPPIPPAVPQTPWIDRYPDKARIDIARKSGRATLLLSCRMGDSDGAFGAGQVVYLQTRRGSGSAWRNAYRLTTNINGRASKKLTFRRKTVTYYRWYTPARAGYTRNHAGQQLARIR